MLRQSRKQHLQHLQLPSMSPRWPALPCAQTMAAETVSSLSSHPLFTIHNTLPFPYTSHPTSHPTVILPLTSIFTTHPLPGSRQCRVSRRRIRQYHLHRLRQSQGGPRPHRHPPPRFRWTCRIRRILTETRSRYPPAKPPGWVPTRAEEKKLRRSNRKPNPNQSNPPAAKPTPPGPKKNISGPKSVSENPNKASNAAKLKNRREKRALKNAEKENQPKQHQSSKK